MIKVAIADDHPAFILGIDNLLSGHQDIVLINTYSNGIEVLERIGTDRPDVLLLDIQMPGKTGDQLIGALKEMDKNIKILILTNFDSPFYIENMLRLGVDGYILKTGGSETIVNAIRDVYSGLQFIDQALKEKLANYTQYRGNTFKAKLKLTTREQEIVQLIADGCTTQEIAANLYLSFHTVENYRQNILLKLDARNVAEMIKKAVQLGLVT